MAVLSVKRGVPAPVAIGAGILAGIAIGVFQGAWVAKLHVPSFVVTLAGLLGWQGALLYVLGDTGTINLTDRLITGITNARLPLALGWIGGIVAVGAYGFGILRERRQRTRAGLAVDPLMLAIGRIIVVAVGVLAAVGIMSVDRNPGSDVPIRGIPSGVLCFVGCITAGWDSSWVK
jgi:D-xylose transport system permease protein